jgi:uncharacterized coiled-coil protein SlyX
MKTDKAREFFNYIQLCDKHGDIRQVFQCKITDDKASSDIVIPVIEYTAVEQLEQRVKELENKPQVKVHWDKFEADSKIEQLEQKLAAQEREIEILRMYGNKDCLAMADEHLAKIKAMEQK